MSRNDSVDSLMMTHIEWCEDALIIEEQGHKADQAGEKKFGKHISYHVLVCRTLYAFGGTTENTNTIKRMTTPPFTMETTIEHFNIITINTLITICTMHCSYRS